MLNNRQSPSHIHDHIVKLHLNVSFRFFEKGYRMIKKKEVKNFWFIISFGLSFRKGDQIVKRVHCNNVQCDMIF